ncbi:MAG: methylmalonyl Co-A mutase-associated GTPase MeaB [Bdellovibrionota bacterium]
MSDQTGDYLKRAKAGDLRALAKLLTALEREGPSCLKHHPELLQPASAAFRLGITGPPGAGKSTLIGQLIGRLRAKGLRVGVLAVDPSSPFTQGAILGDRIRYTEHFGDEGVFIRSLGSRGSLGGLSSSAYLMVRAFDVANFDIVLLETVGVGQTELEIMNVADWVAVTLVPESGDSIQAMKAGLLEIANLFIVNKGDRPGADAFVRELEAALHLDPRAPTHPIPVLKTTATTGEGLNELLGKIEAERATVDWRKRRTSLDRMKAEAKSLLRQRAEREIETRLSSVSTPDEFAKLFD